MISASENARFGLPEVKRGLYAGAAGVYRRPRRLPRNIAIELVVTGEGLDAASQGLGRLVVFTERPIGAPQPEQGIPQVVVLQTETQRPLVERDRLPLQTQLVVGPGALEMQPGVVRVSAAQADQLVHLAVLPQGDRLGEKSSVGGHLISMTVLPTWMVSPRFSSVGADTRRPLT